MISPQQAAANWSAGMAGAASKAKAGVLAVTISPTEQAANAVDRQVAGVIAAQQSGKTAASLRAVSLQSWQNAFINKGIPRLAAGASAAMPKMQAFMASFMPFLQQAVAALPPRGDYNTNKQRAIAMMDALKGFRYNRQSAA